MSTLVSSACGVAESLFASLFSSDFRLCSAPLINVSRLSVGRDCVAEQAKLAVSCAGGWSRHWPWGSLMVVTKVGCANSIYLLKYQQLRSAAAALGRMRAEAVIGMESLAASTAWS
jgi:hypothetical protein